MRWTRWTLALGILASACTPASGADPIVIGAIYPLTGSQGSGGIDEHRGILMAAQLVNEDGGVDGRPVQIRSIDVATADAAPDAVARLDAQGIRIVMGSYGSTISSPASIATAERGMLFWETGAVGMLTPSSDRGRFTFRVPPTGQVLGRRAIDFVANQLAPAAHRDPSELRFAVSYVDDVYGRSVAEGATLTMRALGLRSVGSFGYDPIDVDMRLLARRIARARPDVLFVSAYLEDGVALRRALVDQEVPLLANIGTSSSYCMSAFGAALGADAVGVFASDKPGGASIDRSGLRPEAASLLARASDAYRAAYGTDMSPAALAGFSGAWALLSDVLPEASGVTPTAVAGAAQEIDLPAGSLPNGSGLRFGPPGTAGAGDNLRAASVIWEWVAPGRAAVVWPPALATHPIEPMAFSE
jgi:branched-chain amino acid transport system substrate-binding protein